MPNSRASILVVALAAAAWLAPAQSASAEPIDQIVQGCMDYVNRVSPPSTTPDSMRRAQFTSCLRQKGVNPWGKNKKSA